MIFKYKIINVEKIYKNLEDIESDLEKAKNFKHSDTDLGVDGRREFIIMEAEKKIKNIKKLLGFDNNIKTR